MYSYYLHSLGCPKNDIDSEALEGILREEGFSPVNDPAEADFIIINTCGFIEAAKRESIDAILAAAQYDAQLVVVGCLSQRYGDELFAAIPEIDIMLGVGVGKEFRSVLAEIKNGSLAERYLSLAEPYSQGDYQYLKRCGAIKHFRYLKIAEGCSNHCSYCTIPQLRGPFQSRPMDDILREAELLCRQGAKELIVVAQDTSLYGKDIYGEVRLVELLQELVKIEELAWLRLMYLQPIGLTAGLIDLFRREKKICRYLDMPLQHVDGRILRRMNRWGSGTDFRKSISALRSAVPDIALRTTFMVGYPGESETDFEQLNNFAREINFERAGVFKYSKEEGTVAALANDQIAEKIKEKRLLQLNMVLRDAAMSFNHNFLDRVVDVLIDHKEGSTAWGRTQWDAPDIDGVVIVENANRLKIGEIYPVRIDTTLEQEIVGEVVNEFT